MRRTGAAEYTYFGQLDVWQPVTTTEPYRRPKKCSANIHLHQSYLRMVVNNAVRTKRVARTIVDRRRGRRRRPPPIPIPNFAMTCEIELIPLLLLLPPTAERARKCFSRGRKCQS